MDAPKRIYARYTEEENGLWYKKKPFLTSIEYIRADLVTHTPDQIRELAEICRAMHRIKDLWLPNDNPKPDNVGEYEVLHSLYIRLDQILKEVGEG